MSHTREWEVAPWGLEATIEKASSILPVYTSGSCHLLLALAGRLRWLRLERGERLPPDLVLKVLVPVSLRGVDEHGALGNRVTAMVAPLPVGIGDPEARLDAVARSMRSLKSRPVAQSMGLILDAANAPPAGAAKLVARAVNTNRS